LRDRIVVLGAGGFIGRRVVQALAMHEGLQPVALVRHAQAVSRASGAIPLTLDLSAPGAFREALAGAAGAVNCLAGTPQWIRSSAQALFDAAAAMTPAPHIVHLSSLAAYGSATGTVRESDPLRGDLDEYSAAKADTDRLSAQYGFVTTLRPGIVYGPGSPWWSDRIARLLVMGRLGDLGANGQGVCNLVYVDDVAQAAVAALRRGAAARGPFNLSTPAPVTWNHYFAHYAAALGVQPLRKISARRLAVETRLLSPALKLLEVGLRRPSLARWNPVPPLRPWLSELCARHIYMDVERAGQILRLEWTPLETGLRETAGWFRAGGRTA
jgi:nucleoside-diphosphate-sugar epimerase